MPTLKQAPRKASFAKRYKKTAFYIILLVTLHWSFVAPAQIVFERYFDIHNINRHTLSGLLSVSDSPSFKVATPSKAPTKKEETLAPKEVNRPETSPKIASGENRTERPKEALRQKTKKAVDKQNVYKADLETGIIGYSAPSYIDSPSDNLFKVVIDEHIPENTQTYLVYELYGVESHDGVSRSINHGYARGGYAVKKTQEWTLQREAIHPSQLQKGTNHILFTAPKGIDYQYKIRNLRIVKAPETTHISDPIVLTSAVFITNENAVYLKGFLNLSPTTEDLSLKVNEKTLSLSHHEFEGQIAYQNPNEPLKLSVYKNTQEIMSVQVLPKKSIETDAFFPVIPLPQTNSRQFLTHKSGELSTVGARLSFPDSALTAPKNLSVSRLRTIDIPPLPSGMLNVTQGGKAYRFLPDGTHFEKPAALSIAYDSLLLPKGYSPKDIKTFFFDTDKKKWVSIPRDSIDSKNRIIHSNTTHFTDYINGIIQVPESPETNAFVPTMLSDLEAANPAAEMTLISPPKASQKGTATISYPIKIPAGRNGMQPNINLQYSNEGGSGWIGLGWNITTPAITLDTRWGVPEFNSGLETEIYQLNGEQLMYPDNYLPHRHEGDLQSGVSTELQQRSAHTTGNSKRFTPRKQGSFAKIERLGNSTGSYYWKVTETNGTVHWYGGNENGFEDDAVIKNDAGNVVHWALFMTEDVFGNNIQYEYNKDELSNLGAPDINLNDGTYFYLQKIIYTGTNGNTGLYEVHFETDTAIRTDVSINGRLGLKRVDPYLLDAIKVYYDSSLIRSYELGYDTGRFDKSLLAYVAEKDQNDTEFYRHEFEYYDDVQDENNGALYKSPVNIDLPDANPFEPDTGPNYAMGYGSLLSNSGIQTSESIETGYKARLSMGAEVRPGTHSQRKERFVTIGSPFGENSYKSKGKITLTDINGDGLDDFVYRTESGLKYVPNSLTPSEDPDYDYINSFESEIIDIHGAYDFSRSKGFSKTMFLESYDVYAFDFFAASNRIKTKTETEVYFTDGNGDGLIDIVRNGVVYFNTINSNEPTFVTSSALTENMVIEHGSGVSNWEEPDPIEPTPEETEAMDFDAVRVWTAPRDGEIKIGFIYKLDESNSNGSAMLGVETSHSIINNGEPFRIFLDEVDDILAGPETHINDYNGNNPSLGLQHQGVTYTGPMLVEKGQKIYTRVYNNLEGNNPEVSLRFLRIEYTDYTSTVPDDENNKSLIYEYPTNFLLSSNDAVGIPGTGTLGITWDSFQVDPDDISDDVRFLVIKKIYNSDTEDYTEVPFLVEEVFQNGSSPVTIDDNGISPLFLANTDNDEYISFQFVIESDTNIDWQSISWSPVITYTPSQDAIDNYVPDMIHTFNPIPKYTNFRVMNFTPEYHYSLQATNFQINPSSSNTDPVEVRPNTTITNPGHLDSNDNGEFLFVLKRKINSTPTKTLGKRLITIENGNISIDDSDPIVAFDEVGNLVFSIADNRLYFGFYADGPDNRALLEKYLAAVGQQQSVEITYDDFDDDYSDSHSAIEYYNDMQHLGPQFHNWGQFFYNDNFDDSPNIESDNYGKLINNALIEAPNLNLNFDISGCGPNIDLVDCITTNILPEEGYDFGTGNNMDIFFNGLESWFNSEGLMDQNGFIFPEITFLPATPFSDENEAKWIGFSHNQFSSALSMQTINFASGGGGAGGGAGTSGPFGGTIEETDTEGSWGDVAPGDITNMIALTKTHRSVSRSKAAGYGPVALNISETDYSRNVTDFMDINGDRYPDFLYSDNLVKTNMTGGLRDENGDHNYGALNTFINTNTGLSLNGSTNDIKKAQHASKGSNEDFEPGAASARIGINVNLLGGNTEQNYFLDLNGDGLPDRIVNDNGYQYQLNLGHTINNNTFEPFYLLSSNYSEPAAVSTSFGGGVEFGNVFGSEDGFGGGWGLNFNAGTSASASTTRTTFKDINGDGLLDVLITDGSDGKVRFNTGNGFSATVTPLEAPALLQPNLLKTSRNRSVAASVDGSGFLGFPVCCFLPIVHLKFGATLGVNMGMTNSDTEKSFSDFNGDGFTDYLLNDDGDLKVYYSAIARTNQLKTVTNPLGGSFTIDYKPQPKTYNNPHAKWVMTQVTIDDGYDLANDGKDSYHKYFVYENGKYDRREREFYGFEKVSIEEYEDQAFGTIEGNDPYRTTVNVYHNNSYYLNGLLKESYVVKGVDTFGGVGLPDFDTIFSKTENFYTLYALQQDNTQMDVTQELPLSYDVGGTEGRGTAAAVLTSTRQSTFELTNNPLIVETEMEYDEYGRVVKFIHEGDVNETDDNYTAEISYHDDTTLIDNHLLNVPEEIVVKIGSTVMRKRSTGIIDLTTGTIGEITTMIDPQTDAVTTMEYDSYGNLERIVFPENENQEAVEYLYDYDNTLNKYLIEITEVLGQVEYTSAMEYDPEFDTLLETTDMTGNTITYEYDSFGRTTKIIAPKEVGNPNPYTIKYNYYTQHAQLASVAEINPQDFMPVAVTKHYDVQNSGNDIETFTFIAGLARPVQVKKDIYMQDPFTLPATSSEYMSVSGKTAFDEFGRAEKQYNPWREEKVASTNYKISDVVNTSNSYHSITKFDEVDRPVETTDAEGNESTMSYTLESGLHETTATVDQSSSNQIVSKSYKDAIGRQVMSIQVGPSGDITTEFEYNAIGELQQYTDDEGLSTGYKYDNAGRKLQVNHPDSGKTVFTYDNAGNLIEKQTQNLIQASEHIEYEYDYNRLIAINYPDVGGGSNIANVTYTYGDAMAGNDAGRLITQEDATGMQEFNYGSMGELVYSKRTVVAPNLPDREFETSYVYDSWNRVQSITYPDGEDVLYTYDLGGNLTQMSGEVNSQLYNYIEEIRYDYFEMPTYIEYGNGAKTTYTYTPELRRTNVMRVRAADNQNLLNNSYSYDMVGNVTSIISNASFHSGNNIGGIYQHEFEYDILNRLAEAQGSFVGNGLIPTTNDTQSSYTLQMAYNSTHGITQKDQFHAKNGSTYARNTYDAAYTYEQDTHRVSNITNNDTNFEEDFSYDLNGNLVEVSNSNQDQTDYYWDEENRLRVINDAVLMHHYIYDAGGQRILKSSSDPTQVYENGSPINPGSVTFNTYTTYPSPLVVIKGNGEYTKHYFNGGQRVAARIGEEDDDFYDKSGLGGGSSKEDKLRQKQVHDLQIRIEKNVKFKPHKAEIETKKETENKPALLTQSNKVENEIDPKEGELGNRNSSDGIYFYHPDHLGTGTVLTDANGMPYEFFLNLPFGETMAEQHSQTETYENRWKFTGHELDKETGLYYAVNRYYNPKWSIWLSVDPLAEERQGISPYNYVQNNPLNRIDPDGALDIDVTKNDDGTYTVVGGEANSDKNIYVVDGDGNRTGEVIGEMLTEYSFHNEDGSAVVGANIDLSNQSGQNFFNNEITNVGLFEYIGNAKGTEPLDFKHKGLSDRAEGTTVKQHHYRGMSFNGKIASARDIGNYAAGYVAGKHGFDWSFSRFGFDALETKQVKGTWNTILFYPFNRVREGQPTQRAQRAGHNISYPIFKQRQLERQIQRATNPWPTGLKY